MSKCGGGAVGRQRGAVYRLVFAVLLLIVAGGGIPAGAAWAEVAAPGAGAMEAGIGGVSAQFFANPSGSGTFTATPASPVVFSQTFPGIAFNPPADAVICSNPTGVDESAPPFTAVIRQPDGSCATQVAEGNGARAGEGGLASFNAVFRGTLSVSAPGAVSFNFYADDGWILGVGAGPGGAQPAYAGGPRENAPAVSPFAGYPVVGANNRASFPARQDLLLNFPAAGDYPFELDYSQGPVFELALVMTPNPSGACLSPATLDFGDRAVGGGGPTRLSTLTNCSGAPMTIAGAALEGPAAADYTLNGGCVGATLAPGTSCGVRVGFTPTDTVGYRTASLVFTLASGVRTFAVLSGRGFAATPPFALTIQVEGDCTVDVGPSPGPYASPTTVTLTPVPAAGSLFVGWRSENGGAGWADPWTFALTASHAVTAVCVSAPGFPDYAPTGTARADPALRLAALGIIRGYADGRLGPGDTTLRAQMAALIARSMGWDGESHGTPFPDQGAVDDALWRNVGTLHHYGVARGFGDGTYNPTGEVLYAQTISFITRAMVASGYWLPQADDPALYPNVPASSGHRQDLATYVHYVGAVPDAAPGGPFAAWDQPAPRLWFARAEWQALDSYFGRPLLP